MIAQENLLGILVCPQCHLSLTRVGASSSLKCNECGRIFKANKYGYFELFVDRQLDALDTTSEEYASNQAHSGEIRVKEYLLPLLCGEPFQTILDVGCGVGTSVRAFAERGYNAFGVDLPSVCKYWNQDSINSGNLCCASALRLPFPDNQFDVVYSLGVMEHIGTATGHYTLRGDYQLHRQAFADEILRVTKPNGRIIISCPNKSFPIDIQHSPTDELTPSRKGRFRKYLYNKTGLNVHKVFGAYHLLSYSEVRTLFCKNGKASHYEALPLKGYFGFGRFGSGFLRPLRFIANTYVDNLPKVLRTTFLNPYVLVLIRK